MSNEEPSGWWYLSFADDNTFRGGAIVRGNDIRAALAEATRRDINPGGEVLPAWIPKGLLPGDEFRNRLLSKEEISSFWPDSKSIKEYEAEGRDVDGPRVCADCNPSRQS